MKTKILFFLPLFIFSLFSCEQKEIEPVDDFALSADLLPAGTWEVFRFEDEIQNIVMSSPEDEKIVITFDSVDFDGKTKRNEFEGKYQIQAENKIFFSEYITTEALETDFGKMFQDVMEIGQMQQLPFEVNKNLLKITYEEGQNIILRRI